MSFPYSQQNADSRRRLESLLSGLSDEDLARSTDYGWTVAALLAHLAFWDHRMSVILHRWQEDGFDPSPIDSMAVNDALKVICHALEPHTAAQLALSAAEKADAEFETLSDEFVQQVEQHIAATSTQFRMNRSLHHDGHLNDIETLLQQIGNSHPMEQFINPPAEEVIKSLIQWGERRESVRSMLMTSTRAVQNAHVDDLSDYDVVLVVEDIHPFYEGRSWLNDFGDVLVVYWDPIYPDPDTGVDMFGNVTQYADGLKIDFTVYPVAWIQNIMQASALPAELDAGYRILLDKDSLTQELKQPTHSAYIPVKPSNEIYQKWIEDFFSDVPYVAKCLWRGELLPLKWCLDYDMKHVYLRQMLEWKIGLDTNWSIPVGSLGKGLKKRLPSNIWSQLENCYAGAGIAENWEVLFRTVILFRRVAMEVGEGLGYAYPLELDQRVTAYVQIMRHMQERQGKDGI